MRLATWVVVAAACGSKPEPVTTAPPPAPEAPRPPRKASRIDPLFRSYVQKLPEPATISEGNGASIECRDGVTVAYTLLDGIAERLAIQDDAELVELVPWAHHADPCIRQIAIEAIVQRLHIDSNRLSVPPMHDPDHHLFHEIFVELRDYLIAHHVAMPPRLFDGMWLAVSEKDLPRLAGTWVEQIGPSNNFQITVELDREHVSVSRRTTRTSSSIPDRTVTVKIAKVTLDHYGRFAIEGDTEHYGVWPVRDDVMWFDDIGRWIELRRKR